MLAQPDLRAEVRLAERLGISPRRLWGEEPKVRLIPDGDGGFTIEREPEFNEEDIEMFEAARLAEESISPRGIPYEDEMDIENKAKFWVGDENGRPGKNYAVAAVAQRREAYEKAYPHADMSSFVWPVRLLGE